MSRAIIDVKGISKKYRLGKIGMTSFREEFSKITDKLMRRTPAPEEAVPGAATEFWALNDVSFEVQPGEVVGVVGRNGAGKSTLLKILSRITEPTIGDIHMRGRIASLLEVGTGFHPELSGRENVFLNGAILGMTKAEIRRKFDDIVEFAEVAKFIDTPVKRYSSGMYVRLAFAVAAHLEPEILIIDEVLSVGDAVFQKKCLGKMDDVSKKQGRTILFVSHDIAAVRQLTHRCVVLKHGKLQYFGPTATAVEVYHGEAEAEAELPRKYVFKSSHRKWPASGLVKMLSAEFAIETPIFAHESDVDFALTVAAENYRGPLRVSSTIFCEDKPIGGTFGEEFSVNLQNSTPTTFSVKLKSPRFAPGKYHFDVAIGRGSHLTQRVEYDIVSEVLRFEVLPPATVAGTLSKWEKGWGSVLFLPLVCETT